MSTAACALCGAGFEKTHPRRIYCSAHCRQKACRIRTGRQAAAPRTAVCAVCGREFEAATRVAKTCSAACRAKWRAEWWRIHAAADPAFRERAKESHRRCHALRAARDRADRAALRNCRARLSSARGHVREAQEFLMSALCLDGVPEAARDRLRLAARELAHAMESL